MKELAQKKEKLEKTPAPSSDCKFEIMNSK
jgi:hypothetical protein